MAVVGTTTLTVKDWLNTVDPQGKPTQAIDIMSKTKPEVNDMVLKEGNLPTGNKVNILAGLPKATWRAMNYGVANSKSKKVVITDTMGMLETYSEVDQSLANINGDLNAFLLQENKPFIEAMGQAIAETLFYGDTRTDPKKFMGLTPRYSALTGAGTSENVINGGGTGSDNASIWIVTWGNEQTYAFSGKGQKSGLKVEHKGQVTLQDENNNNYEGYRTHYKWDIGLTVADWRYNVRIANIDVTKLTGDASTGADLIDLLDQAVNLVHDLTAGNPVIYMNRKVYGFLKRQAKNYGNVQLSIDQVAGKPMSSYYGIPVHMTETLLNTEETVA